MNFQGRGILLDIEGTTSSIRFVYDQMFPFVRRELAQFLSNSWNETAVQEACDLLAQDTGAADRAAWLRDLDPAESKAKVHDEVLRLMDGDVKATGLKAIQGLIWESGYANGELISHVYEDVVPALHRWRERKFDLRVYSSGSIAAQKLFFGHTQAGNLLDLFSHHYDTTTGSNRDASSYTAIAAHWAQDPRELLFISDVVAELDAASSAGWYTVLCVRPGNPPSPENHNHPTLTTFEVLSPSE